MKILEFPDFRQTYDYDCGAKAAQTVLAYYGIDEKEEKIIKLAETKKYGTPISGIIKVLNKYKLKHKEGKITVKDIKKSIDKKRPVIILLQAWTKKKEIDWKKDWTDGHYVIAIGYDKKNLYFEDPSSILKTYLPIKEFIERWHDIDTKKKKYINYGIIVYGKQKKFSDRKKIHMR